MATPKTPVSILNEYMFRASKVPHYELTRNEPGPDPVFEFQVTVDHVKVTGSGRNKKDAKHAAARNALTELAKTDRIIREELIANYGPPASRAAKDIDNSDISLIAGSQNMEQVKGNAVGDLTTLCVQYELSPPEYMLVEESGPPHCKNFVMHCKINSLQLVGIGQSSTKKQAKQLSAKRLIEKIKEYIDKAGCNVKEMDHGSWYQSNSVDSNEAKRIYSSIKNKGDGMKARENKNLVISTCHLNLLDLKGSEAAQLQNKKPVGTPEEVLLRFAEEQKITYSVEFTMANKGKIDSDDKYICITKLNTVPELAQFGVGSTESLAREVAAFNLLKCLITMLDSN